MTQPFLLNIKSDVFISEGNWFAFIPFMWQIKTLDCKKQKYLPQRTFLNKEEKKGSDTTTNRFIMVFEPLYFSN